MQIAVLFCWGFFSESKCLIYPHILELMSPNIDIPL